MRFRPSTSGIHPPRTSPSISIPKCRADWPPRCRSGSSKSRSGRPRSRARPTGLEDSMNVDWVRAHCMALPHTTEQVLWGDDLVFKIGGKMYAVVVLGAGHKVVMSFKCTPEVFTELVERPGIIPA